MSTASRHRHLRRLRAVSTALATVLGLTLAVTSPPAAAETLAVPRSIDSTGATDVTVALNNFVAGVPDGSTIVFPRYGSYRVEGTLLLTDRNGLTFEGNRSKIFATTRGDGARRHIEVVRGSNLVFRNLSVDGANPNAGVAKEAYVPELEHQHGFSFRGTVGAVLDRVTVSDVYGDFFYLGYDVFGTKAWTRDVTVRRSTFQRNGRQGTTITGADDVTIEGNRFFDVTMNVVDLEPNDKKGGATNIRVNRNTARNWGAFFLAVGGQGAIRDVSVTENMLYGRFLGVLVKPARADLSTPRSNLVVASNSSDTPAKRTPIDITGLVSGSITGNTQPFAKPVPGVSLVDSCAEVVVSGNTFRGASTEVSRTGTC